MSFSFLSLQNFGDFHTNPCAIQSFSLFNCMQVFFLLWLFAFLFSCFFPIAFFVFSLSMVIHILSFGIFYVLSSRIWLFDFFFFLVATFFSPDQCFRFDRRCSPQWQNFWYAPHFFSHRSSPLVLHSYTSFFSFLPLNFSCWIFHSSFKDRTIKSHVPF